MNPLAAFNLKVPARALIAALVLAAPAASAQVLGPRPAQQEQQAAPDWRSVLAGLKLKPLAKSPAASTIPRSRPSPRTGGP